MTCERSAPQLRGPRDRRRRIRSLTAIAGDVSTRGDVAAIVDCGARRRSALAALWSTMPGIVHQAHFVDLDAVDFDRMFAVHVRGTFLCTRARADRRCSARGDGVVVNIASQLGQIGGVELAHYSAAQSRDHRHDQVARARSERSAGCASMQWRRARSTRRSCMALSEDWRRAKAAELPLGRFGEPEEVAATVAFFASPAASLFVGQTLGPNSGDVMLMKRDRGRDAPRMATRDRPDHRRRHRHRPRHGLAFGKARLSCGRHRRARGRGQGGRRGDPLGRRLGRIPAARRPPDRPRPRRSWPKWRRGTGRSTSSSPMPASLTKCRSIALDDEKWDHTLDVDLKGMFRVVARRAPRR